MIKKLIIFILVFLCSSLVYANHFGDLDIYVNTDGSVNVEGDTNYEEILGYSQEYTSKKGRTWTLEINTNETFSNLIYTVHLPKGSSINYIKTPDFQRIEDFSSGLKLIGTVEDKEFYLIIQYQINQEIIDRNYLIYLVVFIFIFFSIGFYVWKKNNKKEDLFDTSSLTERQKKIFDIILKEKKICQNELIKRVNLPKSSLSRNIDSLVRKDMIVKKEKGMTNLLQVNNKAE